MNIDKRPKNLNLLTIRFPLPAIVSILHRISGVILFLLIPVILYGLSCSLISENSFDAMHDYLTTPFVKFIFWLFLSPFFYHLVAGIRHLLMDLNIGVELKSARLASIITFAVTTLLILIAGIYLW